MNLEEPELYQGTTLLTSNDDGAGNGGNFKIERVLTAGVEYRLKVRGYRELVSGTFQPTTGSYTLMVGLISPPIEVTSVSVSPTSVSLNAGSTQQLSVTVLPSNAPQSVTWSTDYSSIATVNSNGVVTGVSPGIATITVKSTTYQSMRATSTITVNPVSGNYTTVTAGTVLNPTNYSSSLSFRQHRWYKFTPAASGNYILTTTGSTDTYGELYQGASATPLTSNDDDGAGVNFLISRYLTAGVEYRLKVCGAHSSAVGNFTLQVMRGYHLTVDHRFDLGYGSRFQSASGKITAYQNVCNGVLGELFDLHVISTVNQYTSVCDTCKLMAGAQTPFSNSVMDSLVCNHADIPKHLTADARMNEIYDRYGPGHSTLTRVAWTGHELLAGQRGNFFQPWTHNIHLEYMDWAQDHDYIRTYLHELSHAIGAKDHYCYDKDNPSPCENEYCYRCNGWGQPPFCVMTSTPYFDVETIGLEDIYCFDCDGPNGTIRTHLAQHH